SPLVLRRRPGRRQPARGRPGTRVASRSPPGRPSIIFPARYGCHVRSLVRRPLGSHGRPRVGRAAHCRGLDQRPGAAAVATRVEPARAEPLVFRPGGIAPWQAPGEPMGILGILLALALLMWLAYRGWSVLLVAPAAALLAAALSGQPLLAHWTQTFMGSAARFVAQWFPLFLLGGLFGKLMDDSGSITSIARYLTDRLGTDRAM